jgi:hypothetical protein
MRRLGQAARFNAFATPSCSGFAPASANFWASSASCLVCSLSAWVCARECSVESTMNSEGDFTRNTFWAKSNAALVFACAKLQELVTVVLRALKRRRTTGFHEICRFTRSGAHLIVIALTNAMFSSPAERCNASQIPTGLSI